ncbi:MAG: glycosyltransferase family 2 protein [Candidatus Binatia bacterium]
MTTALVIPTFNRRETISSALKSVFETLPTDHYVIVVDSGSSDGTIETIRKRFPQVILVQGDSTMWWAAATNRGVHQARKLGCRHVLTYNDDNVATPGLFVALANAAHLYPHSIISAVCCYLDRPDTLFFAGRMRAKQTDRFYYLDHDVPLSTLDTGIREVELLLGMCTLFPITVFNTVGLFDESAFPSLFADDDLALRAVKAGYRLHVTLNAVVLNDRSKTGVNPYDRRLGPVGICKLLFSRKSVFQISSRTYFLWRHRRGVWYFFKTWLYDYIRMFSLISARWILPTTAFHSLSKKWAQRQHET